MIRLTTPTVRHIIEGIDLTACEVWVTYRQKGNRYLNLKADTVSYDGANTTVTIEFTQKLMSKFYAGELEIQVNWIYPDNSRDAVLPKTVELDTNLLPKVVNHGA